jgi:RHS repeat-associated protein
MRARYYDPWVGRLLSQDPALIGSVAGVSFGRLGSDPQQFNSYGYVKNIPVNKTDPTCEYGRGDGFSDTEWSRWGTTQ